MEEKTTGELQQELMDKPDIQEYLSENQPYFMETDIITRLNRIRKRNRLTKAALARRAGISDVYLYQVLSGRRTPSRDRLLCICIAVEADLEETQQILKQAAYAQLYPRVRRDAIIIHGLVHSRPLREINEALFAANEQSLF